MKDRLAHPMPDRGDGDYKRSDETKYEWEIAEIHESNPVMEAVWYQALLGAYTCDDCARLLRRLCADMFVYYGDNHIALHRESGRKVDASGKDLNPRLLMIIAKPAYRLM